MRSSILPQHTDAGGQVVREGRDGLITSVEPTIFAGDVPCPLETIDAETIMSHTGRHRYGFSAPDEAATKGVEEVLAPHRSHMDWPDAGGTAPDLRLLPARNRKGRFGFHRA